METGPPALIEAIVGRLIPPAVREHVLGDLHERYSTPARYCLDAVRIVPLVIASRIRRNFDGLLVLSEAQVIGLTMGAGRHYYPLEWLVFLVPACVLLAALIVRDAYVTVEGDSDEHDIDRVFGGALKTAAWDVLFAAGCVCAAAMVAVVLEPRFKLRLIAEGTAGSSLMLFAWRTAWRTMFQPGSRRMRKLSGVNAGFPVWLFIAFPIARRGLTSVRQSSWDERLAGFLMIAAVAYVAWGVWRMLSRWNRAGGTPSDEVNLKVLVERRDLLRKSWSSFAVPLLVAAGVFAAQLPWFNDPHWRAVAWGPMEPAFVAVSAVVLGKLSERKSARLQEVIEGLERAR